jgi:hypothetical protein
LSLSFCDPQESEKEGPVLSSRIEGKEAGKGVKSQS